MSGPKNFVARVNKELKAFDLPDFQIINPNPTEMEKLNNKEILKVGRLDGSIYYKATTTNIYNLIKQRRENLVKYFKFIKSLPNSTTMFFNQTLNYKLNRFSRYVQQKSDIVIFQSELSKKMQDIFVGEYYKSKPHKIILNGIPTEVFNPNIDSINLEGSPKLVITASFRLHKRLQDAINLTNYLKSKFPNIKLHIVGDFDSLTRDMLSSIDTSNCVFHNKVKSELLPKIYNSCDVGLSPSIFDPCPNSVAEMIGCGLPVISVLESGASELIQVPELLIKENLPLTYYELQTYDKIPKIDIQKWAYAVENILDNKVNFKELMLNRVETELDIKVVAKRYAEFIRENNE